MATFADEVAEAMRCDILRQGVASCSVLQRAMLWLVQS